MFGPQEIIVIGILFLLIFGPSKLPQMARDVGRFVGEARRSIDEFKEELTSSVEDEEESKKNSRQSPGKRGNPPVKKEKRESSSVAENSNEKETGKEAEYDF